MQTRRAFVAGMAALALGASACGAVPGAAPKNNYPEKPVTMIVPYAAGGPTDLVARGLADSLKGAFPQPVQIVNKPGASPAAGAAEIVTANPDGYTIGMVTSAAMAVQPHITDVPFKGPDDYVPIIKIMVSPSIVAVRTEAPWTNVKEMLDHAKANPGQLKVGTSGRGGIGHLSMESLRLMVGAEMNIVPFGGTGEVVPQLLGGNLDAMHGSVGDVFEHVRAGKLKVLAANADARTVAFGDVPTLKEQGFDLSLIEYWFLIAPKGTPTATVDRLTAAFKTSMDSDTFRAFATQRNFVLDYQPSDKLKEQITRDFAFYGDLTKKLGLAKS